MDKAAGVVGLGALFWIATAMGMAIAAVIVVCVIGAIVFFIGFPMLFGSGDSPMMGVIFIVFGALTLCYSIPVVFSGQEQNNNVVCSGTGGNVKAKFVFTKTNGFFYAGGRVNYSVSAEGSPTMKPFYSSNMPFVFTYSYNRNGKCIRATYVPGPTYPVDDSEDANAVVKCELYIDGELVDTAETNDRYESITCADWNEAPSTN